METLFFEHHYDATWILVACLFFTDTCQTGPQTIDMAAPCMMFWRKLAVFIMLLHPQEICPDHPNQLSLSILIPQNWNLRTLPLLYRFRPFHWRVQGFLGILKWSVVWEMTDTTSTMSRWCSSCGPRSPAINEETIINLPIELLSDKPIQPWKVPIIPSKWWFFSLFMLVPGSVIFISTLFNLDLDIFHICKKTSEHQMWKISAGSNPTIPTFAKAFQTVKPQAALLKRLNLEELVDCALDASVGLWVSWFPRGTNPRSRWVMITPLKVGGWLFWWCNELGGCFSRIFCECDICDMIELPLNPIITLVW